MAKKITLNDIVVSNNNVFDKSMKRFKSKIIKNGYFEVYTEFDPEMIAKHVSESLTVGNKLSSWKMENEDFLRTQLFNLYFIKNFTSYKESFEEATEGLDGDEKISTEFALLTKMIASGLYAEVFAVLSKETKDKFMNYVSNHIAILGKVLKASVQE